MALGISFDFLSAPWEKLSPIETQMFLYHFLDAKAIFHCKSEVHDGCQTLNVLIRSLISLGLTDRELSKLIAIPRKAYTNETPLPKSESALYARWKNSVWMPQFDSSSRGSISSQCQH